MYSYSEPYKKYPNVQRIALPRANPLTQANLGQTILRRRSERDFAPIPLLLEELSTLLYYGAGITHPQEGLRAAPSAGALYPIEIYLHVHHISSLEKGVYHYAYPDHSLELLKEGDYRTEVKRFALGQGMVTRAAVNLVLTAVMPRLTWKYRDRSLRYVYMEAGHIGQNIYLVATALGLGACAVGAFNDNALNHVLDIDGDAERVVYLLTVGRLARSQGV